MSILKKRMRMNKEDCKKLQRMLWMLRSFVDSEWIDGADKNHKFNEIDDMMVKIEKEMYSDTSIN